MVLKFIVVFFQGHAGPIGPVGASGRDGEPGAMGEPGNDGLVGSQVSLNIHHCLASITNKKWLLLPCPSITCPPGVPVLPPGMLILVGFNM